MSKAKLFEGLTNLKNLSDADNAAGKMVLPENSELAGGNYAAARKITNENDYDYEAYHGSTHDITEFSVEGAEEKSDWGAGTYSSNSIDDVNANYAGLGPDLTSRISLEAEEIEFNLQERFVEEGREKVLKDLRRTIPKFDDEIKEMGIDLEANTDSLLSVRFSKILAKNNLTGGSQGVVYPIKINTKNYAVIGEGGTRWEGKAIDDYAEEARSDLDIADFADQDEFEEAVMDRTYELQNEDLDGAYPTLVSALEEAGIDMKHDADNLLTRQMDNTIEGYIDLTELDRNIRESGIFNDEDLTGGPLSTKVLQALGYEGVIDRTVSKKFGADSGRLNTMPGVDYGTEHVVTFPGNEKNIRSIFARFNPEFAHSKNITAGIAALSTAGLLAPEEADASVGAAIKRAIDAGYDVEKPLFHWTESSFDTFKPSVRGKLGAGVYLSPKSNYGERYVDMTSGKANAIPVYVRGKIATQKQLSAASDTARKEIEKSGVEYVTTAEWKARTNELLQKKGFSGVSVMDEVLIFDPKDIKSVNAQFKNTSKGNLLASTTGLTATGAALMQAEETYAADIEQNILNDQNAIEDAALAKVTGKFVEPETLQEKIQNYDYSAATDAYITSSLANNFASANVLGATVDIVTGVPGVVGQLVAGVGEGIQELQKSVESFDETIYELFGLDYDKTMANYEKVMEFQGPIANFNPLETASDAARLFEAAVGQPENTPEEFAKFGGQFFGAFKLWDKALKATNLMKPGVLRNLTAEALAGLTMFDPFEDQFGELLVDLGVENEFLEWITTKDSEAEARLKSALDITLTGAAAEATVKTVSAMLNSKAGRAVLAGMGSIYAARKGVKKLTEKQQAKTDLELQQEKYKILKDNAGDPDAPIYNMGAGSIDEVEINFSRIETSDDVKKLIQDLADSDISEIDKARRGQVGWDQTKLEADKLDAWEVLKGRREGEPLNAAQTVAVRELWTASGRKASELAKEVALNPSPMNMVAYKRQLVLHETIQREVLGARAETARALNAWRMPVKDREMTSLLDQLGREGNIEMIAKRHIALSETGTAEQVEQFINGTAWAKTRDAVASAWYFALLSSPKTHARNFFGNALTTMLRPFELSVAARMPGATEVKRGEATASMFGLMNGFVRALRYSKENEKNGTVWQALSTGQSGIGIGKIDQPMIGGFDPEKLGVEPGTVKYYLASFMNGLTQIPGRALTTADELFKTMNFDMEVHRLAFLEVDNLVRTKKLPEAQRQEALYELTNNPEEYMRLQAKAKAERQTFTDEPEDTGFYKAWRGLGNTPVIGKIVAPFQRTPYNIGLYTFERTPLAPVVKRYRDNIDAGGARAEMAIAQQVTGTTMMLVAADMVMNGSITGEGPVDPQERREWLLTHKPYSIRWQDPDTGEWEHVSYRGLEPVGSIISLAATVTEILQHTEEDELDPSMEELITATTMAVASSMTVQSYMSGVADFFEMMNDPYRNAERWSQRIVGSFAVPAAVRDIAYMQDPVLRHASSMADAVKARTPGLSKTLPARLDRFGNERTRRSDLGPVYDAVAPFYKNTIKPTPIDNEMARLGMNFRLPSGRQNFKVGLGGMGGSLDVKLKDRYPAAYYRFVQLYGQDVKTGQYGEPISASGFISTGGSLEEELNKLVTGKHPMSMMYDMQSDGEDGGKVMFLRNIINTYKKEAKRRVLEEYPEIQRELDKRVK